MQEGCRLGLYEKSMPGGLSWQEKCLAGAKAGFDFLEMSIDETDAKLARLDWSEEEGREVARIARDCGLPIQSICLSGHRRFPLGSNDPAVEERSLEIMENAILLAYRMGVRVIQLAGYDVYYEPADERTKERFTRNLERSVRLAASYGVILAMETMENDFMNTIEKAMVTVKKIDSPFLQVYPDIGNITNGADSVPADIRSGKGHIAAAHLKETVAGVFRDMRFGEGRVNFAEATRLLREQGVTTYTAEFWYHEGECYEQELAHAHSYLRPFLQ